MLVSAKHQHDSAIVIHVSPPSRTSLPPPFPSHPSWLLQSPGLLPALVGRLFTTESPRKPTYYQGYALFKLTWMNLIHLGTSYKENYTVFVFGGLICFTLSNISKVYPCCTCVQISLHFKAEGIHYTLFLHLSMSGYFYCFQLLAIVNNACTFIWVPAFTSFWILLKVLFFPLLTIQFIDVDYSHLSPQLIWD